LLTRVADAAWWILFEEALSYASDVGDNRQKRAISKQLQPLDSLGSGAARATTWESGFAVRGSIGPREALNPQTPDVRPPRTNE
jgi:hypothetical protein